MKQRQQILFVLILVLYSGLALPFYSSIVGLITLFGISLFVMVSNNIQFSTKLINPVLVWLIFSVVVFVANGIFTPMFTSRHIIFIFVAFVIVQYFKETIFVRVERVIFILAIISLFFWLWQTISLSSLLSLALRLNLGESTAGNSKVYANFLLYTINYPAGMPPLFPRNAGFCWEPGPFSMYLTLAIFSILLRNKFKLIWNTRLLLLLLALLTTQSTTGLIATGFLIVYSASRGYTGSKKVVLVSFWTIVFTYLFFTVDIFYDKIGDLYQSSYNIEQALERSGELNKFSSVGRFGGIAIAWEDLKRSPFWGTGGSSENATGYQGDGTGVFIVSGIGRIMSTYGLFGIIIYLTYLYRSTKLINFHFKSNAEYAFFIIIVIGSFSSSLHRQILPFAMIFYSMYLGNPSRNTTVGIRYF